MLTPRGAGLCPMVMPHGRCRPAPAPLVPTCSAVRHGTALGCWKSRLPAQMGMRT